MELWVIDMYVYFIRAGNRGAIKIGVAVDVERRIAELQTGNAFKLNVIAKLKCRNEQEAYEKERKFHKFFKSQRIRGEWFMGNIDFKKLRDFDMEKLREEKMIRDEQEAHDLMLLSSGE